MDDTTQMKLSLRRRFWDFLGYGDVLQPVFGAAELIEYPEGMHTIATVVKFDWKMRIRLFLGAILIVRTSLKTMPLIEKSTARTAIGCLPPGTKL